jgi:hypothetical protein
MQNENRFLPFENFILNTKNVEKWIAEKDAAYFRYTGTNRPKNENDIRLLNEQKKMKRPKISSQKKIKLMKPHIFADVSKI